MNKTLTEADETYRAVVEGPGRELLAALTAARSVPTIDMNGTDITHAILLRLKAFFQCQEKIKTHLGKVYAAPAADFFVETVCFFLKVVLERLAPSLSVASERNIVRRQGSMRPDISIWKNGEVVAAIECKTQLGWNRDKWRQDFELRESRLSADFPNARIFLLVMTGSNWPGFGDDKRVGNQFFVLLNKIWPNTFEPVAAVTTIVHPIEGLFQKILSHAKG
jgi:hypothetical protein